MIDRTVNRDWQRLVLHLPNGLSKRLTALAIEAGIPRAEYVIKLLKTSVAVIEQDNRLPA